MSLNQSVKNVAELFITAKSGTPQKALNDSVVEALRLYVIDKGGTVANRSINDLVNQATAYYFAEQSVSPAPRGNDAIFRATGLYLAAKSQYVPASLNERLLASANYVIASGLASSQIAGPASGWNGTGGSGGAAPTQNSRVNAQITAAYTVVPYQRVNSGLFSLRVKADPATSVTFSGDCVTTTVTTPKLVSVPKVNGGARHEYVYEILLDVAAFIAKNGSVNTAWIYANCQSTDPNMCNRVLGPFIFYPESAANDGAANGIFTATFSLPGGGGTYTSITSALDAAKTAILGGKTGAVLTCIQTGTYTPGSGQAGSYGTPARGYCVVTAQAGVTCTIARTSIADYNDQGSWGWASGINGTEWRGSGIVFDNSYFSVTLSQNVSNRPDWFNGCKWTDSLGRDRLWNGQAHPGRGPEGTNSTSFRSYYTDCYFENGTSPFIASSGLLDLGNSSNTTYGDLHSGANVVHAAFDTNSDSGWFRTTSNAITIQYSGANTATIEKNVAGSNGGIGANNTVVLRENGTVVATLTPQKFPNQANIPSNLYWSWAEMASCINALPNWTATVNDVTGRQARYNYGAVGASGLNVNYWNATDCKTTAFVMRSIIDIHGDWYQTGQPGNVIISNCVAAGLTNNYSGNLFMGTEIDSIIENNIIIASAANGIAAAGANLRVRNNTIGNVVGGTSSGLTSYSEFSNNALESFGGPANNLPSVRNNYYTAGTIPTGTNTTGNFTGGVWASQFVNRAGNVVDMRPQSTLLSTLVTTLASCPYDIMGNLRSASDCAGAVSKNQTTATVFPMVT
jgi:hypothetical protein